MASVESAQNVISMWLLYPIGNPKPILIVPPHRLAWAVTACLENLPSSMLRLTVADNCVATAPPVIDLGPSGKSIDRGILSSFLLMTKVAPAAFYDV